jgi:hypothetical protein
MQLYRLICCQFNVIQMLSLYFVSVTGTSSVLLEKNISVCAPIQLAYWAFLLSSGSSFLKMHRNEQFQLAARFGMAARNRVEFQLAYWAILLSCRLAARNEQFQLAARFGMAARNRVEFQLAYWAILLSCRLAARNEQFHIAARFGCRLTVKLNFSQKLPRLPVQLSFS